MYLLKINNKIVKSAATLESANLLINRSPHYKNLYSSGSLVIDTITSEEFSRDIFRLASFLYVETSSKSMTIDVLEGGYSIKLNDKSLVIDITYRYSQTTGKHSHIDIYIHKYKLTWRSLFTARPILTFVNKMYYRYHSEVLVKEIIQKLK